MKGKITGATSKTKKDLNKRTYYYCENLSF